MEGDDVGIHAGISQEVQLGSRAVYARTLPYRRTERLAWADFPGPFVYLRHEFADVTSVFRVFRLIAQTPVKYSVVVLVCAQDVLDIFFQTWPLRRVIEHCLSRAGNPV